MQGNPVNLTDPFGLCPEGGGILDRLKLWYTNVKNWYNNLPEHDQLALKGMIPFVGIYYDLKNAYLYAQEGQYTEALLSALSAIPGIGDYAGLFKVAGIAAKTAKLAKLAKTAEVAATVCRTVGVAGAVASSAANLVVFTNDAINEYQFDGSVSGTTMLSIGASAAGLGLSAKALSKTALWQKAKNGIKREAEFLWNKKVNNCIFNINSLYYS